MESYSNMPYFVHRWSRASAAALLLLQAGGADRRMSTGMAVGVLLVLEQKGLCLRSGEVGFTVGGVRGLVVVSLWVGVVVVCW